MQEREAVRAGAGSEKAGGPWPRPGCGLSGGTKEKAVLVLVWFGFHGGTQRRVYKRQSPRVGP